MGQWFHSSENKISAYITKRSLESGLSKEL